MISHVDREIFRGPRPADLTVLRASWSKYHVNTIISLEYGFYGVTHNDKYERQFPADFGIQVYNIPCSDIMPPERWAVEKVLDLMSQDRSIYIHCLSGVDRTGFMCAVYRMRVQHWSFEKAHAEWVAMGRHFWFAWWKSELKKYE